MKWALVAKPDLGTYLRDAKAIYDYLGKKKQPLVVESVLARELHTKGVPLPDLKADVFVSLGGDGTILLTLMHTDKPVLAINAGGMGFLSEIETKYSLNAIDRILRRDYRIDERHKLACYLGKQRLQDAANEVTLQTAKIAKLIKFRVEIDGEVSDTLRGDGVIVATATGSTGYSLSVGGPILHPSVEAVVVGPIAPFRLGARPIVAPNSSTITITLLERKIQDEVPAKLVIDGQYGYGVTAETPIVVKPSKRKARFIRFNGGFYDRVRTKLTR